MLGGLRASHLSVRHRILSPAEALPETQGQDKQEDTGGVSSAEDLRLQPTRLGTVADGHQLIRLHLVLSPAQLRKACPGRPADPSLTPFC